MPLENDLVRDRLINQLIIQSNRHSRTLIMLRLKSKWEGMIKKILKEKGVPEDFFYLAIAESELNNEIKSPRNALGMWQFLKKTGLEYGLIIDNYIDQRRDPEKATEVACDYLIEAKRKLGSWTNATASYNVGMAGLKSSMQSQKETDYYKLFLNSETSKYVFRILAMKLVYSNPEAYGYHIDEENKMKPFEYKSIELTRGRYNSIDISKRYGISFAMLKSYNPWLRSGGSYDLVIKKKNVELKLPLGVKDLSLESLLKK